MKVGTEFLFIDQKSKWLSVKFTVIEMVEENYLVEYIRNGEKERLVVGMDELIKVWTEGKITFTNPDVKCLDTEEVFNSLYD